MSAPPVAPRRLFDGEHLRVIQSGNNRDKLAVTFDFWRRGKEDFENTDIVGGFVKDGYAQLHLATRANDWFVNPDLPEALLAIARFAAPFKRKIGFGFSMGGHGGLLVSRLVAFDRLLLVSPHSTHSKEIAPYDDRFPAAPTDPDVGETAYDMVHNAVATEADCVIVYDSTRDFDGYHARIAARLFARPRIIDLKRGGHPATTVLREADRYGLVRKVVLGGEAEEEAMVAAHEALVAAKR